jgi:hypothetical protein
MDTSYLSDFTYTFFIYARDVNWTNSTYFQRFSSGRNVVLNRNLSETEYMRIFLAMEGFTLWDLAFDLWDKSYTTGYVF